MLRRVLIEAAKAVDQLLLAIRRQLLKIRLFFEFLFLLIGGKIFVLAEPLAGLLVTGVLPPVGVALLVLAFISRRTTALR